MPVNIKVLRNVLYSIPVQIFSLPGSGHQILTTLVFLHVSLSRLVSHHGLSPLTFHHLIGTEFQDNLKGE